MAAQVLASDMPCKGCGLVLATSDGILIAGVAMLSTDTSCIRSSRGSDGIDDRIG